MQDVIHIVVRHTGPDSCQVIVAGKLDVATAGDVRDALRRAVISHRVVVVVLAGLLGGARAAKASGVELRLRAVPRFLARLLHLSHTSGAFTIESSPP